MRHGTYSIVALDPATVELGVAVQSHWFSVGPLCAWARAGIGAVATQSVVEPAYGPNALDRLADGVNAQQALGELLAADPLAGRPPGRVIDARGAIAAHTGPDCIAHAGHVTGEHHSCQANMMARDTVPQAMSTRSRRHRRAPDRLLAALDAAEARAATSAASRRRWSSCRPRRAGAARSTCASRTTTPRSTSCAACSRSSAPTTWPARATSCSPRPHRRSRQPLPAARNSPRIDELLFWSGLASPRRRPRARRRRGRRAAEENPTGWSSSTGSRRSSLQRAAMRPLADHLKVERAATRCRCRTLTLSALLVGDLADARRLRGGRADRRRRVGALADVRLNLTV